MKDTYIYPAIFSFDSDGISIEFPDLPGCLPCATTVESAMKNAKEALALHLYGMEKDNDDIPEPTDIRSIRTDKNQTITLIEIPMNVFREKMKNRTVKKTLTIPAWLNTEAENKGINFSQTLQDALKQKLNIM